MSQIAPVQAWLNSNRKTYVEFKRIHEMKQETKKTSAPEVQPKKTGIVRYADVIGGGGVVI